VSDLDTICAGFATVLDTIDGLRPLASWPDQVNDLTAWPILAPGSVYHQTLGGDDARLVFNVCVAVAHGTTVARALDKLNDYVSPSGSKSIPKALMSSQTLNGSVSGVLSITLDDYGLVELGGVDWMGAIFRVEVITE
jgi:hypothetical protein